MPETTETTSFDRAQEEVFGLLADFSRLAEWDPMFDGSRQLDEGPIGVGTRFHVRGTTAGQEIDLELRVVEYEPPERIVLQGTGDGLSTTEDLTVRPDGEGCEVTYHSRFETDEPDVVDAASKPAFYLVGKNAISGMRDWLAEDG